MPINVYIENNGKLESLPDLNYSAKVIGKKSGLNDDFLFCNVRFLSTFKWNDEQEVYCVENHLTFKFWSSIIKGLSTYFTVCNDFLENKLVYKEMKDLVSIRLYSLLEDFLINLNDPNSTPLDELANQLDLVILPSLKSLVSELEKRGKGRGVEL